MNHRGETLHTTNPTATPTIIALSISIIALASIQAPGFSFTIKNKLAKTNVAWIWASMSSASMHIGVFDQPRLQFQNTRTCLKKILIMTIWMQHNKRKEDFFYGKQNQFTDRSFKAQMKDDKSFQNLIKIHKSLYKVKCLLPQKFPYKRNQMLSSSLC